MCVLASRLKLKWSQDKSAREVVVRLGWSLGEGANFYLGKRLKIEWFFSDKAVWCKLVNLVYTLTLPIHPST